MSALPDKLDFKWWRGTTFRSRLTLYTSDTPNPAFLRDLTGYTAQMIIRDRPDGLALYALSSTLAVDGSGIVLGGSAGTIDLVIDESAKLPFKNGVYDLTISNVDTDAIVYGAFRILSV